MNRAFAAGTAGAVLLVLLAPAARAATITFTKFVEANGNDSDFDGKFETITTGPLSEFLAYRALATTSGATNTYDYRGALEFNVSALPSYAVIQSATFRIHYDGASGFPANSLQFNGYVGDGKITADDFTAGSELGGMTYPAFGPTGTKYYSVPVADFLQSVVMDGTGYAGFTMQNVINNQTLLGASLSSTPPQLLVTYSVPEPACLSAVAMTGTLLVGRRRRRPTV